MPVSNCLLLSSRLRKNTSCWMSPSVPQAQWRCVYQAYVSANIPTGCPRYKTRWTHCKIIWSTLIGRMSSVIVGRLWGGVGGSAGWRKSRGWGRERDAGIIFSRRPVIKGDPTQCQVGWSGVLSYRCPLVAAGWCGDTGTVIHLEAQSFNWKNRCLWFSLWQVLLKVHS